jgi:zinc/manganese transport system substrate-binding protein
MRFVRIVAVMAFFLIFLSPARASGPRVVATFLPVYIFAKNVAGDRVELALLVPPGTDIHEFSLRPLDLKMLGDAEIVLMSGAGLEGGMFGRVGWKFKAVDTSEGVGLLPSGNGRSDPHVWMDPLNAVVQVGNIRDALSALDPGGREYYEQKAGEYTARLFALHREIEDGIRRLGTKYLITHHESFAYFARRYGLQGFSLSGPDAGQPLPGRIRDVYDIVRSKGVRAVFTEKQFPAGSLEALKRDLGVNVCTLDTLESGGLDADYYERVMRDNLSQITECLGE